MSLSSPMQSPITPCDSSQGPTADHILEMLAATYPKLRADIFTSSRLVGALEAVVRTTDLTAERIFEALTAREMATAQRPIGVLISRCTELVESPPLSPQSATPNAPASSALMSRPTEEADSEPTPPPPPMATVSELAHARRSLAASTKPEASTDEQTRSSFIPELMRKEPKEIAHRGFRKAVRRTSFGIVSPGPGRKEREAIEITRRITAPIRRSRNIVMLSIKGGVGKTTVSLGLGHTFATHRHDRIVAIDASPDPGTLGQRVEGRSGSIRDLVRMQSVASYADIQTLSTQQSSGLEIISTNRLFDDADVATSDGYRSAVECLSAYFNLVVTDCGSGMATSSLVGLLEAADQVAIVTAPMVDAGWSTGLLLDCLDDNGLASVVKEATVVVNHLQLRVQVKADEFDSYFASRCRAVVHLPWDSNLAGGGPMQLDLLSAETKEAYRALAATVADGIVQTSA